MKTRSCVITCLIGLVLAAMPLDAAALTVGKETSCRVHAARLAHRGYGMLLAEVGLPPGAVVNRPALQRQLGNRFEIRPDRVVLYLMARAGGTDIEIPFTPRFSGEVMSSPSLLYDYYNPLARVAIEPFKFTIVVAAEGAHPKDEGMVISGKNLGQEVRLGGIADRVSAAIEEKTGKESRVVRLGHLQRGGRPTTFDRLTALRFGAAAVRTIEAGIFNVMVALDPPQVKTVALAEAVSRMKSVPLDSDTMLTRTSHQ